MAASTRAGFVLIDVVIAFALIGLLLSIAWMAAPVRTSAGGLRALAFESAALLREARTMAQRSGREAIVTFDAHRRSLARAGASVLFPADVTASFAATPPCGATAILFRPDGTSCGGRLQLQTGRLSLAVTIDWATSGVEIASR